MTSRCLSAGANALILASVITLTGLQVSAAEPLCGAKAPTVYLDGAELSEGSPAAKAPSKATKRWNVLLVLMESTGLSYPFDKEKGRRTMPTLNELADGGWNLTNHFSVANSSASGIFSLFTGLYVLPERRIFALGQGLYFPTLTSYLPRDTRSLLVTPASLSWFFPLDLMQRRGPQKLIGFKKLPFRKRAPRMRHAKDEVQSVTHFLQQLDKIKDQPFFATYYSFVAHWPYPDFGPKYRRFSHATKRGRYLNNLYLLDTQIARIRDFLRRNDLLKKTIIVLVGDHGEAFGQHKGNWIHSKGSFNENYQTPAILYQPTLFAPKRIKKLTTHVDLLPTLLDAAGVSYDPRYLQGESLFAPRMQRNFVFLMGKENTLTSISRAGIKMQLALSAKRCWVYDLARDPGEKRRLRCKDHRRQEQITRRYRDRQRKLLRAYNEACRHGDKL